MEAKTEKKDRIVPTVPNHEESHAKEEEKKAETPLPTSSNRGRDDAMEAK
jgi:hypothetical protein